MTTLDEALSQGQGVERPFRCPVHDDRFASASVNVLKGVWYCLDARTRVLTSDLRWVPIGSVVEGQQLAGFDETTSDGRRQWRTATVEGTAVVQKESYQIFLDDGTTIIASGDHQWLCYTPGRSDPQWRRTDQLTTRNGNQVSLMRLTDNWEQLQTWEAGYAAGAWDGEGTYLSRKVFGDHRRNRQTKLIYYQSVTSPMLDQMIKALDELNISYAQYRHVQRLSDRREHHKEMAQLVVQGKAEAIRALGMTRPARLLEKFSFDELGAIAPIAKPRVVKVVPLGEWDVVAVQTSTGTFVAEGLASHNCYACNASGGIDKKHAPSGDDLLSMLEPEKSARIYPENYLELFAAEAYWQTRFPDWLCWYASLGHDPFTGNDTFPVRTPQGYLAGVGMRMTDEHVAKAKEDGTNPSRYKYPYGWSASSTLGGVHLLPKTKHVVLTEGYADAVSLWECGIPAVPCYGAGIHLPQLEMLFRLSPELVLLGFDMDTAGHRATERSYDPIKEVIKEVKIVTWPKKDPAECSLGERVEAVLKTVVHTEYVSQWTHWISEMKDQHARSTH